MRVIGRLPAALGMGWRGWERLVNRGGSTNLFIILPAIALLLLVAIVVAELVARWWFRAQDKYWLWKPYCREEFGLVPQHTPNCPLACAIHCEQRRRTRIRSTPQRPEVVSGPCRWGKRCRVLYSRSGSQLAIVLQRILERPENLKKADASHVHVGNIGKSGVGAELLDFILQRVLRRMGRFDVIMIMVGASDALHWLHEGSPATPFRPLTAETNMDDIFGWHPLGPFRLRLRQTALTEVVRRIHRVVMRPVWRHKDIGGSLLRAGEMREMRQAYHELLHLNTVEHFEVYFRKALKTAQAKTDRLIVIRQPWLANPPRGEEQRWRHLTHGAVGNVFQKEVKVFYSTEVVCEAQDLIDQRAARVAQELGVECCDLRSMIEPTFDSYYDLYHFTPAGAAAAADIVAKVVLHEEYAAPASPGLSQTAGSL